MNTVMESRNVSLDLLRILACLGVITGHTAGSFTFYDYVEIGSLHWQESVVMNGLIRWSVPVFAMLTGFFSLNPNKALPLKKLYGNKVLRLVISVIFWTCFYALTLHSKWYPFGRLDNHFWYIGMCIGLYISMPVLRMIASDEKLLSYSCWIWLGIRTYYFIGRFVEVPIAITDYVFADFVGYCLWGYYLSRIKMSKKQAVCVYVFGLVVLVTNCVVPLFTHTILFGNETLGVIIPSLAIFLFALKHSCHVGDRLEKAIENVSKLTFGIYMVHVFVLAELFSRMYRFIQQPILLTMICVGAVFVISFGIVWAIKKIPFVGRWVV